MSEPNGKGASASAGSPKGFRLAANVLQYYRVWILLIVAVLIWSIYGFVTLPRSEDPEFDTIDIRVTTVYPGASASKVRDLVTEPLEEAIDRADGVRNITAVTSNGLSFFKVKLFNDTDPKEGLANIEEQIDSVRDQLPEAAFDPFVLLLNTGNIPVNIIALSGPDDYRLLDEWSQVLSDELSRIDEIGKTEVNGLPEREIKVNVDNDRLAQYRIPLLHVANVLGRENAGVPGGKLDIGSRRLVLKSPNDYRSTEDVAATVISGGEGSLVRLADVATVEDGYAEPRYRFRTNGRNAVLVQVTKREGTNNVRIAQQVRDTVERLRPQLPQELEMHLVSDRGASVQALLTDLGCERAPRRDRRHRDGDDVPRLLPGDGGLDHDTVFHPGRLPPDEGDRSPADPVLDLRPGARPRPGGRRGSLLRREHRSPSRGGGLPLRGRGGGRAAGPVAGHLVDAHHGGSLRADAVHRRKHRQLHPRAAPDRDLQSHRLLGGFDDRDPAAALLPVAEVAAEARGGEEEVAHHQSLHRGREVGSAPSSADHRRVTRRLRGCRWPRYP